MIWGVVFCGQRPKNYLSCCSCSLSLYLSISICQSINQALQTQEPVWVLFFLLFLDFSFFYALSTSNTLLPQFDNFSFIFIIFCFYYFLYDYLSLTLYIYQSIYRCVNYLSLSVSVNLSINILLPQTRGLVSVFLIDISADFLSLSLFLPFYQMPVSVLFLRRSRFDIWHHDLIPTHCSSSYIVSLEEQFWKVP